MPKAIAIVAHHDDHVLWIGGTIQRLLQFGWEWTVIAMCVPDCDRQNYFRNSCSELDVTPIAMEFRDYQMGDIFSQNNRDEMRSRLLSVIDGHIFDLVFTHSRDANGEYRCRHTNHFEVWELTRELVENNLLGQGIQHHAYFSYDVIYGSGTATCARLDANYCLQLTYPELLRKCQLSSLAPDANTNLSNLAFPCPNPEGFEGDQLSLPMPFVHRP